MKEVLYLTWRHLVYYRGQSVILIGSIALILFLPFGLRVLVREGSDELMARADKTPLVVGAKGSPLQLVLNALYFTSEPPESLPYASIQRVESDGLARAIPLYVRFWAEGYRIVGTTLDYFDFRGLRIASGGGRQMARLGECVVGAEVARRLGIHPGGALMSSPENVFDLAGVYPLKMRVVGVLAPALSPDDRAVFVDLKTAWVIQGLGHGHQDISQKAPDASVLRREDTNVVANAALMQYAEITDANVHSFHFHGDLGDFPITSILAVPKDHKSMTLLMGRYEGHDIQQQIIRPEVTVRDLVETIFAVERFVVAALAGVGVATLATSILVFMLSLRLRRGERETMRKLGGTRPRIAAIMAGEIVSILCLGAALAGVLTWLTGTFGLALMRAFLFA